MLLFVSVVVTLGFFFVASVNISRISSICQLLGFASLIIAIMLNIRYSLTEFEYAVDDCDFTITRITGNRRQIVCCVALESAISVLQKRDYDHLPAAEKGIIKYSLNQNMKAESYVFLFDFNGKREKVEFEPNEAFVSILKNKIEIATSNKE